MDFKYEGTVFDLYRKTNILKNWTRLYAYTLYTLFGTFIMFFITITAAIVLYMLKINTNKPIEIVVILMVIITAVHFISEAILQEIEQRIKNIEITSFTLEDKTILGKPKIEINDLRVEITVNNARIINPDINTLAYL